MSSICGLVDIENKLDLNEKKRMLKSMLNILKHRGPDYKDYFINQDVALATNGLILNKNHRKRIVCNIDGKKIICLLDGAIYNTEEILKDKMGNAVKFKGISDVELIACVYEKYNEQMFDIFNGEFSIAIWDDVCKRMIISKDHLGCKPLFYYFKNNLLLFASEIKSILNTRFFDVAVNLPAVNDFLSFGYVPHPETMYKDIYKLEPGTFISLDLDSKSFKKKKYWSFQFIDNKEFNEKYYVSEFLRLLNRAVKRRINDDISIGAFLSGGVDSSGVCSTLRKNTNKPVNAFTVGFKEDEYNEIPFAKVIAERLKLNWYNYILKPEESFSNTEKIVYYNDGPFEDTSIFPSFYGAKLASEHVKIVFTGDGPDQIMAGSSHHLSLNNLVLNERIYEKLLKKSHLKYLFRKYPIKVCSESLIDKGKRYLYRQSLTFEERMCEAKVVPLLLKRYFYTSDFLNINSIYDPARNILLKLKCVKGRHPIEQSLYRDIYFYMQDDLIPKVNVACSSNSIERCSPYLDRELVEFFEKVPLQYRIRDNETKYLMKKAFEGLIPKEIIYRRKQGFAIPRNEWYVENYEDYVKQILLDKRCLERGYFKKKEMASILENYFSHKSSYYTGSGGLITSLLTLEIWHRIFIDNTNAKLKLGSRNL